MISNSPHFQNWPLEKQYMAAQFYLSSERPLFINEAQRSKLMALHMQAIYGSCKEGVLLPEIQNCSKAERKRRYNDWKQLGGESRIGAMRKFIDLMGGLFPNWFKHSKIYTEFEFDWMSVKRNDFDSFKDFVSSPSLSVDHEKVLQDYSSSLKSPKKLGSSNSTLMQASSKILNSTDVANAMKTIRSGNLEISGLKSKEDLYRMRHLESGDKNENTEATPIILRNLFENLEAQYNSKKGRKQMNYKDTFSNVPLKAVNNQSLEQRIEHIKTLLLVLDEKANEAYDVEGDALKIAMSKLETDVVESILRPQLEIMSGVIKEIENIFKSESSSKVKSVGEIHLKFVNAIEELFSYLQALDKSKLEVTQQKQNSEKTVKMLEQGFLAIKELNDIANTKYSLYGVTKLTKSCYLQNLQASKMYLPQEDVDIMIDIEIMLTNNEEKVNSLISELKQKDVEIIKLKRLLKEVQEKSYKDNIDLANQCKKLKESLGLLRGNKAQDVGFEINYKTENDMLKNELEQLKTEKNSLFQELLFVKMKK